MAVARKPKNTLRFSQPSAWWGSQWREGLPLGNGVIGASVYGGAASDVLMITHGDLWWQGKDSVLQDVSDKVKDVRKKLDDGDFLGAEKMLSTELIRKGYRPQPAYPLPLCDFKIEMALDKVAKDYSRVLDMDSAEASVSYRDGATKFERNAFVSRARDCIIYEITRTGQKNIDATFSFEMHDKFNARTPVAVSATPDNVNVKCENYWLYYSARSSSGADFGAVAKINFFAGKQEIKGDSLVVTGAEKILVIIKPFVETPRDKAWKDCKAAIMEIKLPYDKLLKEHQTLHQKLFYSAEIELNCDVAARDEYVDVAIANAVRSGDTDPALIEKLWSFGRYLMITGARPDAAFCAVRLVVRRLQSGERANKRRGRFAGCVRHDASGEFSRLCGKRFRTVRGGYAVAQVQCVAPLRLPRHIRALHDFAVYGLPRQHRRRHDPLHGRCGLAG